MIIGSTKGFILGKTLAYVETDINPLKTSVSEGKALIAAAVTGKGVSTAADATFQTMANNINSIQGLEYVNVYYAGNYPSGCTLTFIGFTVNGRSSGALNSFGYPFKVPKNCVIEAYVGRYYYSLTTSGGTQVYSDSDNSGNWERERVAATSDVTITANSSRA